MATLVNYIEKGIGLHEAINAAGYFLWAEGENWYAPTGQAAAVQAIINSFDQLAYSKGKRIELLDAGFDGRASLPVLVRGGTVTSLTGLQVANFLAAAANNYRAIRAAINAATTLQQLEAVSLTTGWPANP